MSQAVQNKYSFERAADIVRYAGGKIVGRTRLQKIACILGLAGFEDDFDFEYHHYGPYSEDLAHSINDASIIGLVDEKEQAANWGGTYSIYTTDAKIVGDGTDDGRFALASLCAAADPIELELAVTAAFLSTQGEKYPWQETENRKPEKAKEGRLEKAKILYAQLREIKTPVPLPVI